MEDGKTELNDESISIFLSTKGTNDDEVSDTMVNYLTYVGADLPDSEKDFEDDFVRSLQETVASIKTSREMERKYMTLQEMLKDERREGRAEGERLKLVSLVEKKLAKGKAPEEIADILEEDINVIQEIVESM